MGVLFLPLVSTTVGVGLRGAAGSVERFGAGGGAGTGDAEGFLAGA